MLDKNDKSKFNIGKKETKAKGTHERFYTQQDLGKEPEGREPGQEKHQYDNQSRDYQDRGKKPEKDEGAENAQFEPKGEIQPSGAASTSDEGEDQKMLSPERGNEESSQERRQSRI